jgi:hypothetical protein
MARNPNAIRIEPRKAYDKAVLGKTKDGRLIYSYWRLINVTLDLYFDGKTQEDKDDDVDWVDYNICGFNDSLETQFKLSYRQ